MGALVSGTYFISDKFVRTLQAEDECFDPARRVSHIIFAFDGRFFFFCISLMLIHITVVVRAIRILCVVFGISVVRWTDFSGPVVRLTSVNRCTWSTAGSFEFRGRAGSDIVIQACEREMTVSLLGPTAV